MTTAAAQLPDSDIAWNPDLISSIKGKNAFDDLRCIDVSAALDDFVHKVDGNLGTIYGPRGMGKSVLLMYKMSQISKQSEILICPHFFPFLFHFNTRVLGLTLDQMKVANQALFWKDVWKVSLGLIAIGSVQKKESLTFPQPKELPKWAIEIWGLATLGVDANALRGVNHLTRILKLALSLRIGEFRLEALHQDCILPTLSGRRIAIAVDGIDEMLGHQTSKGDVVALFSDNQTRGLDSHQSITIEKEVWIAAQQGYVGAQLEIESDTSKSIRIYGSLRAEAKVELAEKLQTDPKLSEPVFQEIRSDSVNFEKIFELNVNLSDAKRLLFPSEKSDLAKKFCGVSRLQSRVVWNEVEDLLQCVRRHTFNTPRGMVWICREIYETQQESTLSLMKSNQSVHAWNEERVLDAINRAAGKIVLDEHVTQLRDPLAKPLIDFCKKEILHNICSRSEMVSFNDAFLAQYGAVAGNAIDRLYDMGLVGIPKPDRWGRFIQSFLGYDEIGRANKIPQDIPYCFLHPALSACIAKTRRNTRKFYRGAFLVGDSRLCVGSFNPAAVVVDCDRGLVTRPLTATFNTLSGKAVFESPKKLVDYGLLFPLLFAVCRNKEAAVTLSDVQKYATLLYRDDLLAERYGRPYTPVTKWIDGLLKLPGSEVLENTNAQVTAIREIQHWFNTAANGHWRLKVDLDSDPNLIWLETKQSDETFRALEPSDIEITFNLETERNNGLSGE